MHRFFLCWFCLMLLASCGNPAAPEPTAAPAVAYPALTVETVATTPASYPGPSGTPGEQQPALFFYIAEPVRATDGQLNGGGPPQAPIRIVNLSRDSALIAETVVGDDGQFIAPLRNVAAGDAIAIVFNDQVTSIYSREQLQPFSVETLPSGELIMSSVVVLP